MKKLLFSLCLILAMPLQVHAQTAAESATESLFLRFLDGLTNLETQTIVALFAEDAHFFGTSRTFLSTDTTGITEYFSALAGGQPGQNVAQAVEYSVHEINNDLAILSSIWKVEFTAAGNSSLLRVTIAAARRDGEWKIVQFHNSAMPE